MRATPAQVPVLLEQNSSRYTDADAAVLFPEFQNAPERNQLLPLRSPFCLPQGIAGSTSAFIRAYSPEFQASGVEIEDWMRFLDGLNVAMSASPPLRVVGLAGMVIGFVPHHWAMIASAGIQVTAGVGIHALSKTLTDRYLHRANEEYFGPRGLRVRVCKTSAMRQLLRLDPTPDPNATVSSSTKAKNFATQSGRVAETVVLHLPIIRKVYNRIAPKAPPIPSGAEGLGGATARRLAMIEGHALPLTFEVPPPIPEEGLLNKVSSLAVRLQTQRADQKEAKIDRKRQLLAIQQGRATSLQTSTSASDISTLGNVGSSSGSVQNAKQVRKDMRDERRALRRAEKGRVKRGLQSTVELADRMEWKSTRMLLWLVVLNAEQDDQIQGREVVDNDTDVEVIPEAEWQAELKRENVEDKQILKEVMEEKETPAGEGKVDYLV